MLVSCTFFWVIFQTKGANYQHHSASADVACTSSLVETNFIVHRFFKWISVLFNLKSSCTVPEHVGYEISLFWRSESVQWLSFSYKRIVAPPALTCFVEALSNYAYENCINLVCRQVWFTRYVQVIYCYLKQTILLSETILLYSMLNIAE